MIPVQPGSQSPQVASPIPPNAPVERTGAMGYWIGTIAMILGVVVVAAMIVLGITRAADVLRFPDVVDSTGGVTIDQPGGYVIFMVEPADATTPASAFPPVAVTGPSGEVVSVADYVGQRTVSGFDSSAGRSRQATAIATFQADHAGRYQLSTTKLQPGLTLGVGKGANVDAGSLALGAVGGGALVLIGLVLVIVTAVRRRPPPMAMAYPMGYPGVTAGWGPGSTPPPYLYGAAPYPQPGRWNAPPGYAPQPPTTPGYPPGPPGYPQQPPGYAPGPPGYAPQPPGYAPGPPGYAPQPPEGHGPPPVGAERAGPDRWWDQRSPGGPPSPGTTTTPRDEDFGPPEDGSTS